MFAACLRRTDQSITATALISTRQRGGGGRLGVAEVFAPHPIERVLVRKIGDEAVDGHDVGERRAHRFEPPLEILERGARLAFHVARHGIEFLGPVRMVMIDRRRGNAGEIDRGAALHLDRGRIGHPHVGRIRPMHVLDRFCHAPPPSLLAGSEPKAKSPHVEWRFRRRHPFAHSITRQVARAFLIARKSRQARRFCSGWRNRYAGCSVAMARISRVPVW